ncbi:MAG: CDP-archaeol synthase [Candidatus Korarchaeota archaeon]|nr:CDP-archaeol synthase [Candidatus Korarchaeota archaeon]NIU85329.1 CDP-archaeol synthase [Candidatus Thorarchaeota archaeon]NIW13962.1 CDP-archaeol synthase [Candidatus Thorarchaeota archaeon]NIW52101.1 CDP-archaeol synthase [Candidatus Korarchaeota archaeon]
MGLLSNFLNGLLFILPAYISNSSPTVVGGGPSIDGGKKARDGTPILGPHKTWRGLIGGITLGVLMGILVFLIGNYLLQSTFTLARSLADCLVRALLLSVGTHVGDLLGSFIKRRMNLRSGAPFPIFDQTGFFIFAILLSAPFYWFGWLNLVIWFFITLGVHPLFNLIAWASGLQEDLF